LLEQGSRARPYSTNRATKSRSQTILYLKKSSAARQPITFANIASANKSCSAAGRGGSLKVAN